MCGILGVYRANRATDLNALEHARDTLSHRGPNGEALWHNASDTSGAIALAHRRLSILDLSSNADQPLLLDSMGVSRASGTRDSSPVRLALVFNGEIYNFVELRDRLIARGHSFRSTGDTEVLLHAYAEWGEDCVGMLNGMFAFAIWDQARARLFCARDRFGEKPFHYVLDSAGRAFAFASEIKALVAMGYASADLDERATYRYFRFGEQAGVEQTIWRGVRRLPAAHTLTISASESRLSLALRRYWDPEVSDGEGIGEEEASREFHYLFEDSVRIRLRSDVPVGTSLSGGLDSSSVLCQVHRLGASAGQRAFTARMHEPALDEGRFVQRVLASTGVKGEDVWPDAGRLLDSFDRLYYHQEEPFPSTSLFASFLVHERAKQAGVTVMLDGQGADEFLAGYAHYPALVLSDLVSRWRLHQWWRERSALRSRVGVDPVPPRAVLSRLARGRPRVMRELAVDADRGRLEFLRVELEHSYGTEPARTITVRGGVLKSRLYADLMLGHLQELLRYTDRNSMAVSVEVRLPFLDHRLVEFALQLPSDFLYRSGTSKWILRRAMQGIVPDEILQRSDKIGFATPWSAWWSTGHVTALAERLREAELQLNDLVVPGGVGPGTAEALGVMAVASARERMRGLVPVPAVAA
jgi:asparagine synthase (glutamine-hydrolysing)